MGNRFSASPGDYSASLCASSFQSNEVALLPPPPPLSPSPRLLLANDFIYASRFLIVSILTRKTSFENCTRDLMSLYLSKLIGNLFLVANRERVTMMNTLLSFSPKNEDRSHKNVGAIFFKNYTLPTYSLRT